MEKKERIEYIDIVKAIGIIAIVFGHIMPKGMLHTVIYSFHVPLFFFTSALFISPEGNTLKFIKGKFKAILAPYYIASIFSILVYLSVSKLVGTTDSLSLQNCIVGMLYGSARNGLMVWNRPLWFLPCLFVSTISLFCVEKIIAHYCGKRLLIRGCLIAVFGMWGGGTSQ